MKNELTCNTASIPSDFGGGANGHLGIIISPPDYISVPTVYVRPLYPGALTIPIGTTQHESENSEMNIDNG